MSGVLKLIIIGIVLFLLLALAQYVRRKYPERFERFLDKVGETIVLESIPGPLKALGAILVCMWGVGSLIGYFTRDVKLSLEAKMRTASPAPDSGGTVDQNVAEDAVKAAAALSASADSGWRQDPSAGSASRGIPTSEVQSGQQGTLPPLPTPFSTPNPPQRPQEAENSAVPITAPMDKSREEREKQRRLKEAAEIDGVLAREGKKPNGSSALASALASAPKTAALVRPAADHRKLSMTPVATVTPTAARVASMPPVPAATGELGSDPEPYVRVQKVRGDVFYARLIGRQDGFLSFRRINGDEFKIPEKSVAHVNGIQVARLPTFGR